MNIEVDIVREAVHARPLEVVERKGIGHPDTLCDAIAERSSRAYAAYCLQRFGRVAHHWFDKVMLLGGEADVSPGAGIMLRPYRLIFAGKAARSVGSEAIPLETILRSAAVDVLSRALVGFDPERHLVVQDEIVDHCGAGREASRYRPQAVETLLALDVPGRVSNDSNILAGFAPLSPLEDLVLSCERFLTGTSFKVDHPDTGTDVKILGRRKGASLSLLVNMPLLAGRVPSVEAYFRRKAEIAAVIRDFCGRRVGRDVELMMNATDRNGRPYLTALGSVADTGDVGVVGRGNRVNGLITPMRPMSIEAPSGKNPLDHTGKLYAVFTHRLAQRVARDTRHPAEVFVYTAKETPLETPDEVWVKVAGPADEIFVRSIVAEELKRLPGLGEELVREGLELW